VIRSAEGLPRKVAQVYQPNEPPAPANRLFGHVFGEDATGFLVTFTGRQARLDDPGARANELRRHEQKYHRYPEDAGAAAAYLMGQSERGRDAYFGVHLYREAGNRLRSNAVGAMSCCWLDEDEGRFPEDGPEPTAIVRSSEGRRHLYWRLARPLSAEWVVGMNRRIAAWSGGDAGKAGLSSVLRVPGTNNYKRHPKVDPVTVEYAGGVEAWDPEVMEQAVPPLPETKRPRPRGFYEGPKIDLLGHLEKANVEILGCVPDGAGVKFAVVCPWVGEHSGGDRSGSYAGQFPDGALWFFCNHAHCLDRGWREFREHVSPRGGDFGVAPRSPFTGRRARRYSLGTIGGER
jgi:hypothetical protein